MESHYSSTKIFFSTYFFMRLKLVFCSIRMKAVQTIKPPLCFEVIPPSKVDSFLRQDNYNLPFLHSESLRD